MKESPIPRKESNTENENAPEGVMSEVGGAEVYNRDTDESIALKRQIFKTLCAITGNDDEDHQESWREEQITDLLMVQVDKYAEKYAQKKYQEGEWVAAKKIQQVIDAHKGLNSDSEVLELVKASLQVIDKLESQLERKEQ